MRFLLAIFLWLSWAGLAGAQISKDSVCNYKYAEAVKDVSGFDGISPYNGGNFFGTYNNDLKPTIDSYRAMTGLSALTPNPAPETYEYEYGAHGKRDYKSNESTYKRIYNALRLMIQHSPEMHKGEVWDAIIDLDKLTSRGPADDWWLRPDDFKTIEGAIHFYGYDREGEYRNSLTRTQKHIAHIASQQDALDWLQAALILSVDRYPWRHNGQMPSAEIENLLRHIENRALESAEVNPWYALLAYHKFYGRDIPAAIQARASEAAAQILICQADSKTFAIITSGDFGVNKRGESGKNFLEAEAKFLTVQAASSGRGLDFAYHYEIQNLAEMSDNKAPFALPLMLSAPSVNDVIKAHRLSPSVTRPLLALPAKDLARIRPATAFTHYLSFSQTAKAAALLETWLDEDPQNRQPFADILEAGLDDRTQQTLITLRMPCLSHFFSDFCRSANPQAHIHRNMGIHRGSGEFIRRELAEWLYPSFEAYNWHQRYYRQYDAGSYWSERRAYERWRDRPPLKPQYQKRAPVMERGPVPEVFASETFPVTQGLAALAERGKLTALAGDRNLVRVISLNIIDWVETASYVEKTKHRSLMAEALYKVVRESRHQSGGNIDGIDVQQKAFELLQAYFNETELAQKTPYWWVSRAPHG